MTPAPRSLASETRAEGTAPPKTHGAACPHRGRRVPHAGVCALPQRARHAHRVRCCAPPPRRFGNQTVVQEDSLKIAHELPDGAGTNYLKYSTAVRGGHTQYDVRHDTAVSGEHQVHLHRISPASHPHLTRIAPASHLHLTCDTAVSGEHQVHIMIGDTPIRGSPVTFTVLPDKPDPERCKLFPPEEPTLVLDTPYASLLRTYDKYGNACIVGGHKFGTRLQLVKQSLPTALTPALLPRTACGAPCTTDGNARRRVLCAQVGARPDGARAAEPRDRRRGPPGRHLPHLPQALVCMHGRGPSQPRSAHRPACLVCTPHHRPRAAPFACDR